jgi:hypothetical protein
MHAVIRIRFVAASWSISGRNADIAETALMAQLGPREMSDLSP